jgi:ubiquinone/menaquinone biosynthesis C-methylase UbiE
MRIREVIFRCLYRLLYGNLAYSYDTVSRWISAGEWVRWQAMALTHLIGPKILDLACGTGTLLPRLKEFGELSLGVEISPQMLAIANAKRSLVKGGVGLVRASAARLPIKTSMLSTVIITFPPYGLATPGTIGEIHRVLDISGRLVIVAHAFLHNTSLMARVRNALLESGREHWQLERLQEMLRGAGFASRLITEHTDMSSVWIVLARKL